MLGLKQILRPIGGGILPTPLGNISVIGYRETSNNSDRVAVQSGGCCNLSMQEPAKVRVPRARYFKVRGRPILPPIIESWPVSLMYSVPCQDTPIPTDRGARAGWHFR